VLTRVLNACHANSQQFTREQDHTQYDQQDREDRPIPISELEELSQDRARQFQSAPRERQDTEYSAPNSHAMQNLSQIACVSSSHMIRAEPPVCPHPP
jgi:hypothetical protein